MSPVLLHPPRAPSIPLLLDSPHSGIVYPNDFATSVPATVFRRAEDTYINDLWGNAPNVGATFLEATFPRIYIDANRAEHDLDPDTIHGGWPTALPSEKCAVGIGLIARKGPGGVPLIAHKLSQAEVKQRIEGYWRPYTTAVTEAADALFAAHQALWHINCHSMGSVRDGLWPDAGRELADIVVGDRDGSTCALDFTEVVTEFFGMRGYRVAVNDPYKGVELVRQHGRPHEGRHSLQIEINKRLYMDEATLVRTPGYRRLKAHLDELLQELAQWIALRQSASA